MKPKIGDRVKIIFSDITSCGEIGTITNTDEYGYEVKLDSGKIEKFCFASSVIIITKVWSVS